MTKKIVLAALLLTFLSTSITYAEEKEIKVLEGVVTMYLIPAKVVRVNDLIKNPEPGTSYIGNEGILVEVDEIPEMQANWTIVRIKYYEYPVPKTIEFQMFSKDKQITVNYHAISLEIIGDLETYLNK